MIFLTVTGFKFRLYMVRPLSLSIILGFCLSLISCSLPAGNDHDICCDASVRNGSARSALPGALHPDNFHCSGWVPGRAQAVLGRNHLSGERTRERIQRGFFFVFCCFVLFCFFSPFMRVWHCRVSVRAAIGTLSSVSNRCQCISEELCAFHI